VLAASGEASRDWLALRGRIEAKDLALLGETLGRLTGPEGIPIEGNGQLTFAITGPANSPGVSASGTFPLLRYAQNSVRDLRLRLEVPDLRQPLEGDGQLNLRTGVATIGPRRLDSSAIAMNANQGAINAEVRTRGFLEVFFSARGQADRDRKRLTLRTLELRYPEATWTLEREAHLRLDPDHMAVDGLALRSGRQHIGVDLDNRCPRLMASIDLEAIDLSRLPKTLVDPQL
jgi:translocation and assembly module TamB